MEQISSVVTRVSGRAYLGAVNTSGKTTAANPNTIGLMFDINPVLLNDRVAVVASTFDKYVYQGMRFTYVPQCPTTTAGSVALVFERDPEQDAANPQSAQFLSEVMSYENPVLTPAWQECSTSYRRDPKELKTWFIGGSGGAITPRETSQGHMICYLSNATSTNTGYGFIVMDYILDLVSPNIMPNLTGSLSNTRFVSQYLDGNGGNKCLLSPLASNNSTAYATSNGMTGVPWVIATTSGAPSGTSFLNPFFTVDPTFASLFSKLAAGAYGELVINGADTTGTAVVPNYPLGISGLFTQLGAVPTAQTPGVITTTTSPVILKQGARIFWAAHSVLVYTGSSGTNTSIQLVLSFHQTLPAAVSMANQMQTSANNYSLISGSTTSYRFLQEAYESGDVLGTLTDLYGFAPGGAGASFSLGGWLKCINIGTATSLAYNA
jgi:hypothetical protein